MTTPESKGGALAGGVESRRQKGEVVCEAYESEQPLGEPGNFADKGLSNHKKGWPAPGGGRIKKFRRKGRREGPVFSSFGKVAKSYLEEIFRGIRIVAKPGETRRPSGREQSFLNRPRCNLGRKPSP